MKGDGLLEQKSKKITTTRSKMRGPMGLAQSLPKETTEECMPEETAEECKRANNARETTMTWARTNAMLDKMWGPHVRTGLATM